MVLANVKSPLCLGDIHKLNAVKNLLAMFAALAFTGRHRVLWVAVQFIAGQADTAEVCAADRGRDWV
jgi:hypothetical protein